jgi:hypothetical protein
MKNLYKIEDELYIINSSEKIKENTQTFKEGLNGDWFYNTIYNFITRTGDITPYDFKIILTTNKLLIKDGIQPIPNEFLEWFVKNQICEKVKVEGHIYKGQDETEYKIIIPKEEQKQHIIDIMKSDEELGLYEQTKCYCGHTTYCDCGPLEEPKQEWSKSTGDIAVDYAIGQLKAIQKCMHLDAELAYKSLPKQETTFEEAIGKKATDYCEQYKGTDKYNVAMLAIEFGYKLKLEEDEK